MASLLFCDFGQLQREVEAVMAHEIGHVKRKHMFWLIAAAAALLLGAELIFRGGLLAIVHGPVLPGPLAWVQHTLADPTNLDRTSMILAMAGWFVSFGWVSRRFERQADTFAVQHLATRYGQMHHAKLGQMVDPAAADTMIQALQQIADLNHIPTHRNSWRHGSIHWRQTYLQSLIGQPLNKLRIDTHMFWINTASALVLMVVIGFESLIGPML